MTCDQPVRDQAVSFTRVVAAQYADREYWDKRYGDAAGFFDWYHGYDALRELFDAHLSRSCPVLQVLLPPTLLSLT